LLCRCTYGGHVHQLKERVSAETAMSRRVVKVAAPVIWVGKGRDDYAMCQLDVPHPLRLSRGRQVLSLPLDRN
jgi:hypothetical protein